MRHEKNFKKWYKSVLNQAIILLTYFALTLAFRVHPCQAKDLEATNEQLKPGTMSELLVAQVPMGSADLEKLLSDPDSLQWNAVKNGSPELALAKYLIIYRAKIPQFNRTRIFLRRPFAQAINSEGIGLRFFVHDNGGTIELDPAKDRYASVAIDQQYAGKEILIANATGPITMYGPSYVLTYSEEDHLDLMKVEQRYIGYVLGMLGIMTLYNVGMMLLFRNRYLIYYVAYTIAAMAQFSSASGLFGFFSASQFIFYASSYFAGVFIILFSMEMLSIKAADRKLYSLGFILIFMITGSTLAVLLGSEFVARNFMLFGPSISLYSFFLTARSAYQGNKPAYAMLVGWLCHLSAFSLVALQHVVPDLPPEVGWALPIGVGVEVATFSFAMGQKLRLSELKFMRENEHAFEEMRKMVYPHQLKQIRQGDKLENTMPTHSSQACVISFDIVGSSKIKHPRAKDFFRNVFARCNATMNEGYDGINLQARAYRIKEMGDGFLCSIGYPFAAISDNPANDAVDLAEQFARILLEESTILQTAEPVTCGIGIAIDTLIGFYPESGTKEYDLFGRGLILATRYEGMRKCLFEAEKRRSILIIQELVYLNLDAEHQKDFKVLDIKELSIVVRDDPAAARVYYKLMLPNVAAAMQEEISRKAI